MRFSITVLFVGFVGLVTLAQGESAEPISAHKAPSAPSDRSRNFPPPLQRFPLYGDGTIPNSKPTPDEESGADRGFIRNVSRPRIDVYLPAPNRANGASLLVFPGGGYAGLTFDYEGTQQARFFVDHGFAAFVVKYRIPSDRTMESKSIGPLQDAQQALRFVRLHAKDWNLDPERVGAIGYSAGGHVAATLATHFDQAYVDNPGQISLRPDFPYCGVSGHQHGREDHSLRFAKGVARGQPVRSRRPAFLQRTSGHQGHAAYVDSPCRRRPAGRRG